MVGRRGRGRAPAPRGAGARGKERRTKRFLALLLFALLLGLVGVGKSAEPIRCSGPSWMLTVREVMSEQERSSFAEYDPVYMMLARATGRPAGFEIRRVMAREAADYMVGCVRVDCSAGPLLFGPSLRFSPILADSTRVESDRMLFFEGPISTNTCVWDASCGAIVNGCRDQNLNRDAGGCIGCAIAFPHGTVVDLRRVMRLTFSGEGRG